MLFVSPGHGPRRNDLVPDADSERVRVAVVAEEYSLAPKGTNITIWLMMWSLAKVSVEYGLAETQELLAKGPPSYPLPGGEAVLAAYEHVEQEADMLEKPRYESMVDGDVLVDPGL